MIWQLGDKNKKLSARAYFLDITPNFTHYLTRKCIYSKRMKNQFLCLSERVNLCGIHRSNNSMKRNSVNHSRSLAFLLLWKKINFQLGVASNQGLLWFCSLYSNWDWPRKLALTSHPIRRKTGPKCNFVTCIFSYFMQYSFLLWILIG